MFDLSKNWLRKFLSNWNGLVLFKIFQFSWIFNFHECQFQKVKNYLKSQSIWYSYVHIFSGTPSRKFHIFRGFPRLSCYDFVTSAFPLVNPTASFSLWCILKDPYLNNLQNLTLHFKRLYCKDYIMRIWHSITNWMEGSREKSTVCYREWVLTCSFCYWFEVVAHPCYIIFGLFM